MELPSIDALPKGATDESENTVVTCESQDLHKCFVITCTSQVQLAPVPGYSPGESSTTTSHSEPPAQDGGRTPDSQTRHTTSITCTPSWNCIVGSHVYRREQSTFVDIKSIGSDMSGSDYQYLQAFMDLPSLELGQGSIMSYQLPKVTYAGTCTRTVNTLAASGSLF